MSETTKRPPAIVLGAQMPALGVIQSLGLKGIECWACAPTREIASRSRYAKYWRIPDPRDGATAMMERILELAERLNSKPVIIPTVDQYAQALARNKDQLRGIATVCSAESDVVDLLIDKLNFSTWAEKHGLDHPFAVPAAQFRPEGPLKFPVVAKPRFPVLEISRQSLPSELRCVLLEDSAAWEAFQHRYHQYLPDLLIQKYIHGNSADMVSIGLYADENSTIKGLFVGRKIRGFPPFFGDTRAGQNFLVDEAILKQVEESVAALKYRGLAEFEYKIDKNSGQFSLIEINPRSWSWIGVTPASSADIPWIAYQDLTGVKTEKAWCNSNPGTIKYVRLLNDFVDVTLRNRWGYPAWAMSPRQWWRSLDADKLVIAEFGRRDWSLAFWSTVYFVASIASSLWRRIKNRLKRLKPQNVSVKASVEL